MLRTLIVLPLFIACTPAQATGLRPEACQTVSTGDDATAAECRAAANLGEDAMPPPSIRVDNVFFALGGSALDASARTQLDALAVLLDSPPMQRACVRLIGHADASGHPDLNLRISRDRAETVASYLRARVKQPEHIVEVQAVGSTNFLPGFDSSASENRRVALLVRTCPSG
jgi:outer membrane protein OmpA-like peptidoglycan-associated protein